MSQIGRKMIVALSVLALALPAAAIANQGHGHGKGKGKGKTHNVAYVFKGIAGEPSLESGEGTALGGELSIEVKGGNSRVRKAKYTEPVTFKIDASTPIVVEDTNGDGARSLADVKAGDTVLVKCMLPKSDPGTQPFAAKRLVDQTHPAEPTS